MILSSGEATVLPDGRARTPAPLSHEGNAALTVGGLAGGGRTTPSSAATLLVFLDDDGFLHWKAAAKGARWHNSKSEFISDVCEQADDVMPDRYVIDYVEVRS